jgi:hypothetical protein
MVVMNKTRNCVCVCTFGSLNLKVHAIYQTFSYIYKIKIINIPHTKVLPKLMFYVFWWDLYKKWCYFDEQYWFSNIYDESSLFIPEYVIKANFYI